MPAHYNSNLGLVSSLNTRSSDTIYQHRIFKKIPILLPFPPLKILSILTQYKDLCYAYLIDLTVCALLDQIIKLTETVKR